MADLEELRVRELREARIGAVQLFPGVEARGLIRPGITEGQLNHAPDRTIEQDDILYEEPLT
jgi:hypothetical protein